MLRDREFFSQGVSQYVPAMQYASNLVHNAQSGFSLGTPAAAAATAVIAALAIDAANGTIEELDWTSDARYGRNLVVKASADPDANFVVDVYGIDYLMQPMVERFTGADGSTANITGNKAFYKVLYAKIVTQAGAAVTASIGTGAKLGLPYKGDVSFAREGTGTISPVTYTPGDMTTPSATTGDPRGTYTGSALNGAKEVVIGLWGNPQINADGEGGLHGLPHYFG